MFGKNEELDQERALEEARKVRETMQTEGWKIIEKICWEGVESLDSLKGVTSMKEVLGRQYAGNILRKFLTSLTNIVNQVGEAEKRILPLEDAIYKIKRGKESTD